MKTERTYERKAVLVPKFGNIDNYLVFVCCLFRYKDTIKVLRNREEILNTIAGFSKEVKEGNEKYKPVLCITHLDRFYKLFDLPLIERFPPEGDYIIEAVTDNGVIIRDSTKLGVDTGTHSWLLNHRLHSKSKIPEKIMSEMLKELNDTYKYISKIKAHGYTINQNSMKALYSSASNLLRDFKSVRSHIQMFKKADKRREMDRGGYEIVKKDSKGGLIFVNENHIGKTLTDVHSFDITSAYPYVMFAKKMYCSDPVRTSLPVDKNRENYIISFDLINPIPKIMGMDPYNIAERNISRLTLNGIRLENALKFYDYSDIRFKDAYKIRRYECLPFDIRHAILEQFIKKEESRGKGAEFIYNKLKLNNFYGGCAKDPCKYAPSIEEGIKRYNDNITHSRFKYAIGASITGHIQNIMLDTAYKLGDDFVYCHTDCIKFLNYEKNKHIFEEHNKKVRKELEEIRDNFTIPFDLCSKEGIKQREAYIQDFKDTIDKVLSFKNFLGSFKDEGVHKKFKILGKNKYIADDEITFSGVNGKALYEYLKSKGDVYENFTCNLKIPYEVSGRKDMLEVEPFTITVTDMNGEESTETVMYKLATDWCAGMEVDSILDNIP